MTDTNAEAIVSTPRRRSVLIWATSALWVVAAFAAAVGGTNPPQAWFVGTTTTALLMGVAIVVMRADEGEVESP